MRELKFRAWDKESCKWCSRVDYDYERGWLGITPVVVDGKYIGEYDTTRGIVVEQFTGLKDRNGKEIYEGDIVEKSEDGGFSTRGVVEWSEKAARFWVSRYYYPNGKKWVVIGNIHENKDLLE